MSTMTHEQYMANGSRANERRTIERLDPALLEGPVHYIFNIYDCEFTQNLGSAGVYYIPPCPEGKEWVRSAQTIPWVTEDIYPHFTDHEEYRVIGRPASQIIPCLLGYGPMQGPSEDIRRFGVFVSLNEVPSKSELKRANDILEKELRAQVQQADEMNRDADPLTRQSVNNPKYYRALNRLNISRNWKQESSALTLCPFCTTGISPTASICPGCKQVVNKAAFEATQKQLAGA